MLKPVVNMGFDPTSNFGVLTTKYTCVKCKRVTYEHNKFMTSIAYDEFSEPVEYRLREGAKEMKETVKKETLDFRALVYQRDFSMQWVAHCLETDIIGHGDTPEKAIKNLEELTEMHVNFFVSRDEFELLDCPADSYIRMWYNDITIGSSHKIGTKVHSFSIGCSKELNPKTETILEEHAEYTKKVIASLPSWKQNLIKDMNEVFKLNKHEENNIKYDYHEPLIREEIPSVYVRILGQEGIANWTLSPSVGGGLCNHGTKTIFFPANNITMFLHEIAHALCPPEKFPEWYKSDKTGHFAMWADKFTELISKYLVADIYKLHDMLEAKDEDINRLNGYLNDKAEFMGRYREVNKNLAVSNAVFVGKIKNLKTKLEEASLPKRGIHNPPNIGNFKQGDKFFHEGTVRVVKGVTKNNIELFIPCPKCNFHCTCLCTETDKPQEDVEKVMVDKTTHERILDKLTLIEQRQKNGTKKFVRKIDRELLVVNGLLQLIIENNKRIKHG